MSENENKKKMVGPWRSVHGAIWLIGIVLMISYNWWWPGILVLIAISGVFEALLQKYAPEANVEENPVTKSASTQTSAESPSLDSINHTAEPISSTPVHRLELLPTVCPNCNGPIRANEIKWTGPQSANCPYCGSNLPMQAPVS
jgi:predicted Zn-ribbon and HTH transcriptional regulator